MQRRVHVIGLGKSGVAAARLLQRNGWEVTLSDRSDSAHLKRQKQTLTQEGLTVQLGDEFTPDAAIDLVVVSPGVPWHIPPLDRARDLGIETIGEAELAWRYLADRPWVGITGTNGKTTTTALTAAIFQAAGFHAPACGNIGYAACELALEKTLPDWVIAELSSYQIEASTRLAPHIGVWTTFTPDHLDRHKTLENYYAIKASLIDRASHIVINGDDPYLRNTAPNRWDQVHWTSLKGKAAIAPLQPTAYIEDGWATFQGDPVVRVKALRMMGGHNRQNLLLAVAAARLAGIEPGAIAQAVADFSGVPHRLEHIGAWQGIDFINDSKATNYDAAEVGLRSVIAPTILIAGGEAKVGNDSAWLKQIQAKAAAVLLIGNAAAALAQRLDQVGYTTYEIVETMDRAVSRSTELAKQYGAKGVLLSPACASFDQYPNFEVRGDHFRQLCLEKLL